MKKYICDLCGKEVDFEGIGYPTNRLLQENKELKRQKINLEADNLSLEDGIKKLTEEKEKKMDVYKVEIGGRIPKEEIL